MILGIDEVGRGPWAGPLVVGAVILGSVQIDGITDSKKLSKKKREAFDLEIREKAQDFGLGWVEAVEIDNIGLSKALTLGTIRAVEQIKSSYHEIIIDGTVNFLASTNKGNYVTTLKKADLLVPSVSCASIIAKVARDNYMMMQDRIYPEYGFSNHVGYGTTKHVEAIEKFGITPLHRLSYEPLKKYRSNNNKILSTKQIGDMAETKACEYLKKNGHKIITRNWKNKLCEIDIVSKKGNTIYFVEVKYREKNSQGGGLAVITNKKINQMKFAAEYFSLSKNNKYENLLLSIISVAGKDFHIEKYLEIT